MNKSLLSICLIGMYLIALGCGGDDSDEGSGVDSDTDTDADTAIAPETDLEGNPRVGEADMGAYEYQPE